MEINNNPCQNCNQQLPAVENLFFCPFCASQLKCKNCQTLIVAGARACIACGDPVRMPNDKSGILMNEFDFEQKGDSKKLKSRFTNEVGSVFAEAFGLMVGGAQSRRVQNPFISPTQKLAGAAAIQGKSAKADAVDAVIVSNDLNEILTRYFKVEDGKVKLINSRLKQSGKLDQAIRLAILTVYSYECTGQSQIEKSAVAEMLGSAKLYDAHFQGWLARCDEISTENTKLQLTVPGREAAETILTELADESIVKGTVKFSKTGKASTRRKKKQGETDLSETGNPSGNMQRKAKGPMAYFDQLIKEGFFKNKRKLNEIIDHLKVNKAQNYAANELSTPLKRMIKSERLKRIKNSDGQYEYYV